MILVPRIGLGHRSLTGGDQMNAAIRLKLDAGDTTGSVGSAQSTGELALAELGGGSWMPP